MHAQCMKWQRAADAPVRAAQNERRSVEGSPIERALLLAAEAGQWGVVEVLARQLEAARKQVNRATVLGG